MKPAHRLGLTSLAVVGALGLSALVTTVVFATPAKPDYALTAAPASQSIQQGQSATTAVTVTGTAGFGGSVALSATGLPAATSASFSASTVTVPTNGSANSTLSVVTTPSTPVGTSTITITGTNGPTKRSVSITLTVTRVLNGSFALSSSPSSATVGPGSTAAYGLTLTRSGGFTGAVSLSTSGALPTGTSVSFNPVTISPDGTSSTVQVSTASSTPDGTYTIVVVGAYQSSGQSYYQNAQLQLVVDSKTANKPFTISGGSPARPLAPGQTDQPLDLALSNPNNQTLNVTNLSVTVRGTSNSACGPDNFVATQYSGAYPLRVPANATNVTLSALGVPAAQQPQLRMADLSVNQDTCKGVTVTVAYSGSGQGG